MLNKKITQYLRNKAIVNFKISMGMYLKKENLSAFISFCHANEDIINLTSLSDLDRNTEIENALETAAEDFPELKNNSRYYIAMERFGKEC